MHLFFICDLNYWFFITLRKAKAKFKSEHVTVIIIYTFVSAVLSSLAPGQLDHKMNHTFHEDEANSLLKQLDASCLSQQQGMHRYYER